MIIRRIIEDIGAIRTKFFYITTIVQYSYDYYLYLYKQERGRGQGVGQVDLKKIKSPIFMGIFEASLEDH